MAQPKKVTSQGFRCLLRPEMICSTITTYCYILFYIIYFHKRYFLLQMLCVSLQLQMLRQAKSNKIKF